MNQSPLGSIDKIESDLWEAADQLRANSKLTSSEYCMPVLGVIFLRHAANRFDAATKQIQDDQAAGRTPKRNADPGGLRQAPRAAAAGALRHHDGASEGHRPGQSPQRRDEGD
jgi:type I restriction-modification system DNA methylase subunit